jgi:hypothetical protein
MNGWREIGVLVAGMVAKEPPYIQIAIGLSAAFVALMILEGLRASFAPRRPSLRSRRATPSDLITSLNHTVHRDRRSAATPRKSTKNPRRRACRRSHPSAIDLLAAVKKVRYRRHAA